MLCLFYWLKEGHTSKQTNKQTNKNVEFIHTNTYIWAADTEFLLFMQNITSLVKETQVVKEAVTLQICIHISIHKNTEIQLQHQDFRQSAEYRYCISSFVGVRWMWVGKKKKTKLYGLIWLINQLIFSQTIDQLIWPQLSHGHMRLGYLHIKCIAPPGKFKTKEPLLRSYTCMAVTLQSFFLNTFT